MEKLEKEQQDTFEALQKPTMSLIASFYETPEEIKGLFADMMAIYEAKPTEENAKAIFDKIMGDDSVEDKKTWLKKQAEALSSSTRMAATQKYIVDQTAVPKGLPTSGMLLSGLGVVSAAEKNTLMEAQSAARLISDIEDLGKYQDAKEPTENTFLDKPFATEMQRLENLVNVFVYSIYAENCAQRKQNAARYPEALLSPVSEMTQVAVSKNAFLQKARNEALKTLKLCSVQLKKKEPTTSEKIADLTTALTGGKDIGPLLTDKDYKDIKERSDGHVGAYLVWRRADQILAARRARQAELSKQR